MRSIKTAIYFCIVSCLLFACEETVELPVEPAISFKSLDVIASERKLEAVRLTFSLRDGDGDMGLSSDHNFVPFHEFDLVLDANNKLVKRSNVVEAPFFRLQPNGERVFFNEQGSRPMYNDIDYLLVDSAAHGAGLSDTVLIHRNLFHNNIYLTLLKKESWGFRTVHQSPIGRGRLPIHGRFDVDLPLKKEEAIISEVSFEIGGTYFQQLKPSDTLKLQFYIFDRKLHQSNVEITPEFTLENLAEFK